jgi:hypothetical protein
MDPGTELYKISDIVQYTFHGQDGIFFLLIETRENLILETKDLKRFL